MAYSDFTLEGVCQTFGLHLRRESLFDGSQPVDVPHWLYDWLTRTLPFAFGSEKARSEFLVGPLLISTVERHNQVLSIYSGQCLDVAPERGLVGECKFILARTPPLPILSAPIAVLIEAKNHDIEGGLGQCAAQMLGARCFNEQKGNAIPCLFGSVTNGEIWQFLKLDADILTIDSVRYYLDNLGNLLGALNTMTRAIVL
jgi:hypothetical protein